MYRAPHVKTVPSGFNNEGRHPTSSRTAGAGEEQTVVSPVGATDPELCAVQHPMISVAYCASLDCARRVAASRRLGQGKKGLLFATQHRVKVLVFLLIRCFE